MCKCVSVLRHLYNWNWLCHELISHSIIYAKHNVMLLVIFFLFLCYFSFMHAIKCLLIPHLFAHKFHFSIICEHRFDECHVRSKFDYFHILLWIKIFLINWWLGFESIWSQFNWHKLRNIYISIMIKP